MDLVTATLCALLSSVDKAEGAPQERIFNAKVRCLDERGKSFVFKSDVRSKTRKQAYMMLLCLCRLQVVELFELLHGWPGNLSHLFHYVLLTTLLIFYSTGCCQVCMQV